MKPDPFRQRAMRLHRLAVVIAALLASASAFAQSDEPSPPPMVPVDEAPPDASQTQPQQQVPQTAPQPLAVPPKIIPGQRQEPLEYQQPPDAQQQYQQPYDPQQQQYPQQDFQQLEPQQRQDQQPPEYTNQRQSRQLPPPSEKTLQSERTKHFLGLLSGSLGLGDSSAGVTGSARIEIDIGRVGLLFNYTNFNWVVPDFTVQVHQFHAMGGFSIFSSDLLTFRLLGGLDIINRETQTAFNVIVGTNLRSMWGRIGLDGAFLVTLFPFRQLEGRAALVFQFSVFEVHLGWRVQVIDATASGNLGTLFTNSPGISGPVAGVGITF